VAQQEALDMFCRERLGEQGIVPKIELSNCEVIRRAPIRVNAPEFFRIRG
jgi:hypothetical protein